MIKVKYAASERYRKTVYYFMSKPFYLFSPGKVSMLFVLCGFFSKSTLNNISGIPSEYQNRKDLDEA